MKYGNIGRAPGTLLPKDSADVMRNPGAKRNFDLADTYLLRERTLLKDLVKMMLNQPTLDKAQKHFEYFLTQWKQNIISYIKNEIGQQSVTEKEIEHYRNNYKYLTTVRLVQEYVLRLKEREKIMKMYPTVPVEKNYKVYGIDRNIANIHGRLMSYWKELQEPDLSLIR